MAHGYLLVVFFCDTKRIEWLGKIYSKSEVPISKQIQMFKIQNSKQHRHMWTKSDSSKEEGFGAFEFGISYLFRISIFGFYRVVGIKNYRLGNKT